MSFPPSTMPFGTTTLVQKLSLLSRPFLRSSTSILTLSGLFYAALASQTAHAECTTNKPVQISWNKDSYDPRPSADANKEELVLPMPCGGAMVFRRVRVNPLIDKKVNASFLASQNIAMGLPLTSEQLHDPKGTGYNDNHYKTSIAAPFSQKGKEASVDENETFYYIGKYEVTNEQYKAIMKGEGRAIRKQSNFPVNNISFLEAQQFAEKWTTWLRNNVPDSLPKRGDRNPSPGFIRLPTEAEWAFAAAGGMKNSSNGDTPVPWPEEESNCGKNRDDCIVDAINGRQTTDAGTLPQAIGTKSIANPLSLYDIVGNVSEMVLTPYQMDIPMNYQHHGLVGGPQVFGGSILFNKDQISSATRTEVPPYNSNNEPYKAPDIGFRVVIGAMALADQNSSLQAKTAFLNLIRYGGNLNTSQVRKDNEETDLALEKLKKAALQDTQDKNELQNRILDLTKRIEMGRAAQAQANMQRDQADQDNVMSSLTTLLTLSRQIAYARATIYNYTVYVNDPENSSDTSLPVYKNTLKNTKATLKDAVDNYISILKPLSADPHLNDHIETAKSHIVQNLESNYTNTLLSSRVEWLNIAINNIKDVASGAAVDDEKSVGAPIEKAGHMTYIRK